jgi:hypothetical protein
LYQLNMALTRLDLNEFKIIGLQLSFKAGGFMVTICQVIAFISEGDFKCSLPPLEKFDEQCPRSSSFSGHVMVLIKRAVSRTRVLLRST